MQFNPATLVRKRSVFCESHSYIFSPKSGWLKSGKLNFSNTAHFFSLTKFKAAHGATIKVAGQETVSGRQVKDMKKKSNYDGSFNYNKVFKPTCPRLKYRCKFSN
jgi:hypothetical protein